MRSLPQVGSLVVKVGTSSLTTPGGRLSRARLGKVVREIVSVRLVRSCVLVTSGARAAGWRALGESAPPEDMPGLQAAAAVGQGPLLAAYREAFGRHGITVGQVLLTQEDLLRGRSSAVNVRNTLRRLLQAGVVPVVNENDTVGTGVIRFGDNDRLAALVAVTIGADLLVLLSDVAGIYTRDPRKGGGRLVREIGGPAGEGWDVLATGPHRGAGGMSSKLDAARIAGEAGIPCAVAAASAPDVLRRLVAGNDVGTYIWPPPAARRRGRATGMRGRG